MKEGNLDIEYLITAFTYPFGSMNESFYLRKKDLKVIGVHIFDTALISECNTDYNSGLTKEEERDIKEAIIANEKKYNTHAFIPRLTIEQRFEIINEFIDSTEQYRNQLLENMKTLSKSVENYNLEFYKNGIQKGVQMEYLTNGIGEEEFKTLWTKFYREKTKKIALEWLNKSKIEI